VHRRVSEQEVLAIFNDVVRKLIQSHVEKNARDWFASTFNSSPEIPPDLKLTLDQGRADGRSVEDTIGHYLEDRWINAKNELDHSMEYV
jgi:hypothetical protein